MVETPLLYLTHSLTKIHIDTYQNVLSTVFLNLMAFGWPLKVGGQCLSVKDACNLEGLSLGRVREAVEAAESGANRKLEHTQHSAP